MLENYISNNKFGLKLWSTNEGYVASAKELFIEGIYQYIELYVVPNSYDEFINIWKNLHQNQKIPFIIHAPHFGHGMNLAKQECQGKNIQMYNETKKFADVLSAEVIIFHPGIDGDIKETARQLIAINDKRIIIENKPYYAINSKMVCNGNSPKDIDFLIKETGVGFCLDIGHAFCSAKAQGKNEILFLEEMHKLNPKVCHISDGIMDEVFDAHLNFGFGNYDLKEIIGIIGDEWITIETNKNSNINLDDFKKDVAYLKKFFCVELTAMLMAKKDMMSVFNLANDPIVRQSSFNAEEISLSSHKIWFDKKLLDKNTYFYKVIDRKDKFMGYVRYDFIETQNEFIVSVAIEKKFRGKGLCPMMLEKTWNKLDKKNDIIAYIKHQNSFSLNCFIKAGYSMEEKDFFYNGQTCYKLRKKR